jgi:hypothetical protein
MNESVSKPCPSGLADRNACQQQTAWVNAETLLTTCCAAKQEGKHVADPDGTSKRLILALCVDDVRDYISRLKGSQRQ